MLEISSQFVQLEICFCSSSFYAEMFDFSIFVCYSDYSFVMWKFAGICITGAGEYYGDAAEESEHRTENINLRRTIRCRLRLRPVYVFLQVS